MAPPPPKMQAPSKPSTPPPGLSPARSRKSSQAQPPVKPKRQQEIDYEVQYSDSSSEAKYKDDEEKQEAEDQQLPEIDYEVKHEDKADDKPVREIIAGITDETRANAKTVHRFKKIITGRHKKSIEERMKFQEIRRKYLRKKEKYPGYQIPRPVPDHDEDNATIIRTEYHDGYMLAMGLMRDMTRERSLLDQLVQRKR